MAHRNIKITRDLVQTCNKLCAFSKTDACSVPRPETAEFSRNASQSVKSNKFQSDLSNIFTDECTKPDVFSELNETKTKNSILKSPSDIYTHKSAALDAKNRGLQFMNGTNPPRSAPFKSEARFYSTTSKKSSDQSCKPIAKKCQKDAACPRFLLEGCPPTKGSNCKRMYIEPCCTKKMAPYPSYSELCAYRMEDDPSECQQCPWQRCGGVDDIKPRNPNRNYYHTSTRNMNMAMVPRKDANMFPFVFHKQCDASKDPCKEPPPRCKKDKKEEKCPEKKKKKEPKCSVSGKESWIISGSMKYLDLQKNYYERVQMDHLKNSMGVPSNLAEKIVYELKKCPPEEPKCPKHVPRPPVVDHTINEKYRPKNPCCEDAKRGRQPPKRPKVFVPDPRNY